MKTLNSFPKKTTFYDDAEKVRDEGCYNVPSCTLDNVKDDTQKCLELLVEPNVMEGKGPATGRPDRVRMGSAHSE